MADHTLTQFAEPATTRLDVKETEAGSVFVSNYPPYSFWSAVQVPDAFAALNSAPEPTNTLGLYLHIPFCRKRCKFCYFRVYTDKNSSQIAEYLEALSREVQLYAEKPAVAGRPLKFVYFGGGTPSFISVKHLQHLVTRLKASLSWDGVEEVTFECEPGTLSQAKLEAIREIGVTRLSLGIENFHDAILKENGRAHLSREIYQVLPWIQDLQFQQLNVDLIAGMVGETWHTWKENVQRTIDIDADSVTIYQLELPFNTVYTRELSTGSNKIVVADWQTKREWHDYAIEELSAAGYEISSAYTMVKDNHSCKFVYRDSVWRGTDMLGAGVASFSHISGVHYQNAAAWHDYLAKLQSNNLPLHRAFTATAEQQLTREMILQLKLGKIKTKYFKEKFNTDILKKFERPLQKLQQEGLLSCKQNEVRLTRSGLLRVDQLLPEFYSESFRNARYT
ncbi:MAG: coproporphyrinogen-III oxidase family protein [bacterium]